MPTFNDEQKKQKELREIYEYAKKKGLTTWEINFLKSVKLCIDGERVMTPRMQETLDDIAFPSSRGKSRKIEDAEEEESDELEFGEHNRRF